MSTLHIIVTVLAAAANLTMATLDLRRDEQVLANMTKVDLPHSWLPLLGTLKALGGTGLVIGFAVPAIGLAAAAGLVIFFIGAIVTHVRAREYSFTFPGAYLLLAVGALLTRWATW